MTDLLDELEALLAAQLSLYQGPAGWQPISTAREEGLTEVLGNFDGLCRVMWWSPLESWMTPSGATSPAQPAHWMPLHLAPSEARKAAEPER